MEAGERLIRKLRGLRLHEALQVCNGQSDVAGRGPFRVAWQTMLTRTIVIALTVILVGSAGVVSARPKTDVVVVKNGDRVTCEIKSLSKGMLTVSTDAMGTIDIKWEDVIAVQSSFTFQVETSGGLLFLGSLEEKENTDMLTVAGETSVAITHLDAVEISPLGRNFWDRNDGSLSIGFSYTRSTDIAQLNADWTNLYRSERNLVTVKAAYAATDEGDDGETTRRVDITLTYYHLLYKKKWTAALSPSLQRNDEQGLKRRILIGAGVGVNAIKSNSSVLLLSTGVALNSEVGEDTTDVVYSGEGVFAASYSFFRYHSPKREITTSLSVFPSFTEKGRYRFDFNLKFRIEVVSDFFVDLSYYTNYDNNPATEGAHTTDYGIVTSVGWSY